MSGEQLKGDIKQLEQDMEEMIPKKKAAAAKLFLDKFMPLALIMLGSLIAFRFFIPVNEELAMTVNYMNIAVLLFFSARLGLSFLLADSHKKFLRQHWFDALLVLPAFALVKDARLLMTLESQTEEKAILGFIFARSTTLAGQVTKMYTWGRRILKF